MKGHGGAITLPQESKMLCNVADAQHGMQHGLKNSNLMSRSESGDEGRLGPQPDENDMSVTDGILQRQQLDTDYCCAYYRESGS